MSAITLNYRVAETARGGRVDHPGTRRGKLGLLVAADYLHFSASAPPRARGPRGGVRPPWLRDGAGAALTGLDDPGDTGSAELEIEMPARKKTRRNRRLVRKVHRLRVSLLGIKPPIVRVVELPSDCTLGDLHEVLQIAFGWTNSHLHYFDLGPRAFGPRNPESDWEDEDDVVLDEVVPKRGAKLRYEYDLGDSWRHQIVVEKVGPPEAEVAYPRCLFGARACPPEDCGGTDGYANLLTALTDPNNEEHADAIEWTGGGFDPEAFDPAAVNRDLATL